MRILHLEASTGWGGQEIRILREAEGMRSRGHEIFFAIQPRGKLLDAVCKARFTFMPLSFHKESWLISLARLLYWIRKHRIDVINTHSSLDAWLGGIAGRLAGVPVLRTRHLSTPIKKGWNSRFLYGTLADAVVTTCAEMVLVICEQSGKAKELCWSIPTGVNPEKIISDPVKTSAFRNRYGIAPTDFLVGTACFMRSWKGISDFLQAAHLLRDVPGLRWMIIGGGHEERFRLEAADLKLDGIVQFTGHLEDPLPALGALDLFTLLSTAHEGVSQAILQAAYLQKPLVATPTGGLREVCQDGITGLLVPPFSPKSVAQAVQTLKEDCNLREQFGKNGKRLVEDKFLYQKMLDQMEEVFYSFQHKSSCPARD
ncbi:MAG: hypothetical protein A3F67_11150 [Verrucomicrobia bacterium RIFCSPHIGHO2_12_FULL_41_10]|nr:MAG: hypothetical protein A3F67_11150 [Verrucomicrobia bacterium RIFCSPHIGHO2_12_FULL_41_10]